VTLTGAGGSGKTRLALAAAHALLDDFADGVWFVSLASLTDEELVEPTIAQALGARGDLNVFMRGKRLLPLLDNLEQLLPDVAETVAGLEARVLATSRERLKLAPSTSIRCRRCPSTMQSHCSHSGLANWSRASSPTGTCPRSHDAWTDCRSRSSSPQRA
jgi:predicted ATPase